MPDNQRTHRVAVYGSLKRGFYNHHFLRGAEFEGEDRTEPRFTMLDLGAFPGVATGGRTAIAVEVYRVSTTLLGRLDELEDVPRVYRRTRVQLPALGKVSLYCLTPRFLSTLGPDRRRIIASGCWESPGNGKKIQSGRE